MDLEKDYPREFKRIETISARLYYSNPGLRRYLDIEDLKQAGMVVLWECISTYKPELGVLFRTYATIRIRGAMIDCIRQFSPLPKRYITSIKEGTINPIILIKFEKEKDRRVDDMNTDEMDLHDYVEGIRDGKMKRMLKGYLKGYPLVRMSEAEGISESTGSQLLKREVKFMRHDFGLPVSF